jgi:hypothetical protein
VDPSGSIATTQASEAEAQPRVSVIMIFLNAERFIDEAIRSVLAQTVNDWELVLVDDGSTDSGREIVLSYVDSEPERIRLYEHPGLANRGTGPSRNLGMRMARGRYLAFLDADDAYEPHRLERCVTLLDNDPAIGIVISHDRYWRRWPGNGASGFVLPDEVIGPVAPVGQRIAPPRLIAATLATRGAPMPAICSITFRRHSFDQLGGVPDGFDSQYEDQALIVKLLLSCTATVISDCLARYRQHPESLTHRARQSGEFRPGKPHEARRVFLSWILSHMRELGIDDPLVRRAIDAELAAPLSGAGDYASSALVQRLRSTLFQAAALLPTSLADATILRWWAWKRARVAWRAARVNALLLGRGQSN